MAEIAETTGTAHYDPPQHAPEHPNQHAPEHPNQHASAPLIPAHSPVGTLLQAEAHDPEAQVSDRSPSPDLNTPAHVPNPDTARRGGQNARGGQKQRAWRQREPPPSAPVRG